MRVLFAMGITEEFDENLAHGSPAYGRDVALVWLNGVVVAVGKYPG